MFDSKCCSAVCRLFVKYYVNGLPVVQFMLLHNFDVFSMSEKKFIELSPNSHT